VRLDFGVLSQEQPCDRRVPVGSCGSKHLQCPPSYHCAFSSPASSSNPRPVTARWRERERERERENALGPLSRSLLSQRTHSLSSALRRMLARGARGSRWRSALSVFLTVVPAASVAWTEARSRSRMALPSPLFSQHAHVHANKQTHTNRGQSQLIKKGPDTSHGAGTSLFDNVRTCHSPFPLPFRRLSLRPCDRRRRGATGARRCSAHTHMRMSSNSGQTRVCSAAYRVMHLEPMQPRNMHNSLSLSLSLSYHHPRDWQRGGLVRDQMHIPHHTRSHAPHPHLQHALPPSIVTAVTGGVGPEAAVECSRVAVHREVAEGGQIAGGRPVCCCAVCPRGDP